MKQDRLSALRQRLKRGSFEFGALLEGVSTIEDERRPVKDDRMDAGTAPDTGGGVALLDPPIVDAGAVDLEPVEVIEDVISDRTAPSATVPQPALLILDEPVSAPDTRTDRLRAALDSLGCRMLQEAACLRAALAESDVEEGGFHLAHLNQVLELLRDIDPDGELSRGFGTVAAPPAGRAWPASTWTVMEFSASPFSGLLSPKADEAFVRDLLYAAWGVTFEAAE